MREPLRAAAAHTAGKIVGFDVVVVGTPWRELTFVEVHTDEVLHGVGEVRM